MFYMFLFSYSRAIGYMQTMDFMGLVVRNIRTTGTKSNKNRGRDPEHFEPIEHFKTFLYTLPLPEFPTLRTTRTTRANFSG